MRVPVYEVDQILPGALPPINAMGSAKDYSLENVFNFKEMGQSIDGNIDNYYNQAQREQLKLDTDYAREQLNTAQSVTSKFLIDAQQRSPKENMNLDQELDGMFKNQYEQSTKGMNNQQKELFTASFDKHASDYLVKAYQMKTDARNKFNISTVNGQNDILQRDYFAGNINYDTMRQTMDPNIGYLAKDMAPEERKAFIQDTYSKIHLGYADRIASTDPIGAKAYLEKYKSDMNPIMLEGAESALNSMQNKQVVEANRVNMKGGPEMVALYNNALSMPYDDYMKEDFYASKYDKMPKVQHDYLVRQQKDNINRPENKLVFSQNAYIEKSLEESFGKAVVLEKDIGGWDWVPFVNPKKLEAETVQSIAMEKESLKAWLKEKPRTQEELTAKVQEVKTRLDKPLYLKEFNARVNNLANPQYSQIEEQPSEKKFSPEQKRLKMKAKINGMSDAEINAILGVK